MKKRSWKGQEKLQIVLEGLKGQISLAELCSRHQISQAQYYQWRDRLIKEGNKIFDYGGPSKTEESLKQQVGRLQRIIGELTVELKKSEELGL